MQEEVCMDIAGQEGRYQVSNYGRVRSLPRKSVFVQHNQYSEYVVERNLLGKIISPRKLPTGYLKVSIEDKDFYIHRLVCSSFIRQLEDKEEINHKDGDKTNNHLWNLEIVSRIENQNHAVYLGLNKTVDKAIPVILNGVRYESIGEASRATGFSVQVIHKRLNNPNIKPYKHHFTVFVAEL